MYKLQNLKDALFSPDEETRRLAVIGLSEYPIAKTKGSLFQALGDESWRVRKEAVELLSRIDFSPGMTEELVTLLRSQDNAGMRNAAVEVLVRLGEKAVPVLHPYVKDADHDVRKFIIDIMGSIGNASFVPLLIDALDDPDANVSVAAVENLGKIGDHRAVDPLLNLLDKPDVWLQYAILEALGRIAVPVQVSAIAPLAAHGLLKKAAYECLGAVGGIEAVPILLSGLGEKAKNARRAAAFALDKIRDTMPARIAEEAVDPGLRELQGTPVVELLLECLSTPDTAVRKALVKILGVIGDKRAAGELLRGCGDYRLRSCCLQAFQAMGEIITPFLEKEYFDADEGERCIITYLCGEMGLQGCTSLLAQGMLDALPAVRKEAVVACGKLGLVDFIPDIIDLLDDFDEDVREGAVVALARLAELDKEAVEGVAEVLAFDKDPEKRRDAAHLFGALKDTERLSLLMKDEDVTVRKTAVSTLADLKNKASTGHLLMALVDEDPEVRISAALALGETAGADAVDSLLLLLKDENPWVRCAALKSLGKLKGRKALHAVETILENAEGAVMIAAIEALGEMGGGRAQGLLERALRNEDEEVVKTAMSLLARNGEQWLGKYREALILHPNWGVRNHFVKLMADLMGKEAGPYLRKALEREVDDLVKGQIRDLLERYE